MCACACVPCACAAKFGDVKFVLMGGSPDRMLEVANLACKELGLEHLVPYGCSLCPVGKQGFTSCSFSPLFLSFFFFNGT